MSASRYASGVHQREGRTALFATLGTGNPAPQPASLYPPQQEYERSSSPYSSSPSRDYNASLMSQLESQNEETVGIMQDKVSALKDLGVKIGDQINSSKLNLGSLGTNMETAGTRIKSTMRRMKIMADQSGVSWKVWLGFFAVVFVLFFLVWI